MIPINANNICDNVLKYIVQIGNQQYQNKMK